MECNLNTLSQPVVHPIIAQNGDTIAHPSHSSSGHTEH